MTTNEIIAYYANLLVLQYLGKPKAYATIVTLVTPVVMDQLPKQVENGFDITTAIGDQLDIIGKYAGVTRNGADLNGNPITLNDEDFVSLIRIAIIKNMSGSSLATIQGLLHTYFENEIFVYDDANMHMSYLITAQVGSQDLVEMFITQGLLPKPMGVQLASVIYISILDLFGFRTYTSEGFNIFPFNTYDDYNETWTWLSYDDTIPL